MERALLLAGGIIECNYGNLNKIQWTRAARTDAGVHAVAQCCAMRLLTSPHGKSSFIESVNSFLPSDIRLHAMTKVISKLKCIFRYETIIAISSPKYVGCQIIQRSRILWQEEISISYTDLCVFKCC